MEKNRQLLIDYLKRNKKDIIDYKNKLFLAQNLSINNLMIEFKEVFYDIAFYLKVEGVTRKF